MTTTPTQPATNMQAHRGVMILILGILGLLTCVIFGIVAWVMGNGDLKKMDAGQMDLEGRGLTSAGRVCGMISTILGIVGTVIWVIMMVAGGAAAISA